MLRFRAYFRTFLHQFLRKFLAIFSNNFEALCNYCAKIFGKRSKNLPKNDTKSSSFFQSVSSTISSYRIYYEDTDAGGIVYYANYLKFAERARTDFLRNLGVDQSKLANEQNLVFVVRKCEAEYLSAAKLDDLISVSVSVKEMGGSFLRIYQEIKLQEKLLNRMNIEIVCVDKDSFTPKRIPKELRSKLVVS